LVKRVDDFFIKNNLVDLEVLHDLSNNNCTDNQSAYL